MSRRRVLLLWLVVALALWSIDLARAPQRQWTARAELAGIHLYQRTLSGHVGVRCRFKPSCSHYAAAVIRKHGALIGTARAAWRILRCGPWTPMGTVDQPQ
jgi:putative membrane protein insertion efficiency factor